MKVKNLAFFGAMATILSVAGANATTLIASKNYVDNKVSSESTISSESTTTAPNEKAVYDALALKANAANIPTAANFVEDTIDPTHTAMAPSGHAVSEALAGKQATIDANNKLSGTLISDGTVGTTQLSTAVNNALTAAGTALQSSDVDQTYSGTSTKAQSGVAVKSAIDALSLGTMSQEAADDYYTKTQTDAVANAKVSSVNTISTTSTSTAPNEKAVSDALALKANSSDIVAQENADWDATEGKAQILHKPTTISGYGITDAYTKTQADAAFDAAGAAIDAVNDLDGGTITSTTGQPFTTISQTDGQVSASTGTITYDAAMVSTLPNVDTPNSTTAQDCTNTACILTYKNGKYTWTPMTAL